MAVLLPWLKKPRCTRKSNKRALQSYCTALYYTSILEIMIVLNFTDCSVLSHPFVLFFHIPSYGRSL